MTPNDWEAADENHVSGTIPPTSIQNCRLFTLPKLADARGSLTFIEPGRPIPFAIARTYWTYDVPGGESRGGHAYRQSQEFIISLSGAFEVVVDDGTQQRLWLLNRPYFGLHVPRMIWRRLESFSTNAVGLILSSTNYEAADYVRDYEEFLKLKIGRIDASRH